MLKKVVLDNFKCFRQETEFYLSRISIMYGRNGRGKSTVAQSLLLLAQTMKDSDGVGNLQLTGRHVALGTYEDVVNRDGNKESFGITLQSEKGCVEMRFCEHPDKPQMAKAVAFLENGRSRFEENVGGDGGERGNKSLSSISDVKLLQDLKDLRYVSAGRLGPQNSIVRRDALDDDDLGVNGENVIQVLLRQGEEFVGKVKDTLSEILGGAAVKVLQKDQERIELYINSHDGETVYKPVNVGFGYSYVLPVIVAAYLAEKGSLLIVENPEAHLHPGAQSRIMKFLITIAKEKDIQLIVETHSDHVVNGMRIAVKEGLLKLKESHVLFFSDDERPVKIITCDKNGTLNDRPDDFLDEWTMQLFKLV